MIKSILEFFRRDRRSSEKNQPDITESFSRKYEEILRDIEEDENRWEKEDALQSEKALEQARAFAAQGNGKSALIYLSEALRVQPELVRSVGDYKEFDLFRSDEAFTTLLAEASSKLEEDEGKG